MKRWLLYGALGLSVLLLALAITGVLVVRSVWFHEKVRLRIVYEVERVTGGKVEIGSFHVNWKTLVAEIRPFVLRGTEPISAAPLFRADSVQVGLKIVSILKRDIDLQSIVIDRPSVTILVDANGRTNFPSPQTPRQGTNPLETFLKLEVRKLDVRDGNIAYSDRRIPLALKGENLRAVFSYDFDTPRYIGDIAMSKLNVTPGTLGELPFDFAGRVGFEKERIVFEKLNLGMGRTTLDASGTMTNVRTPLFQFDVSGNLWLDELVKPLKLPVERTGYLAADGKLQFGSGVPFSLDGRIKGSGLALRLAGVHIAGLSVASKLHLDIGAIELTELHAGALGGTFSGEARIEKLDKYRVTGNVRGMELRQLSRFPGVKSITWNGTASGPIFVAGSFRGGARDLTLNANLDIKPAAGPQPLQGTIDLAYDGGAQKLRLGQSNLSTANTKMRFTGTLGERLQVSIQSRNLDDVLPAIAMFTDQPPKIPIVLKGGLATFDGEVVGPVTSGRITGRGTITQFEMQGRLFDSFAADLNVTPAGAELRNVALIQGPLRADGDLKVVLANWKLADSSPLSGRFTIRNAHLSRLLAEATTEAPVEGILSGTIEIGGTLQAPAANANLTIDKVSAYGERFDRVRADLKYTGRSVEVVSGAFEIGPARLRVTGAYDHLPNDWTTGDLRFAVVGENVTLAQIQLIKQYGRDLQGQVAIDLQGTARIERKNFSVRSLTGVAAVRDLVIDERPIGNLGINANTTGNTLQLKADVDFRGTKISGDSQIRLVGDHAAQGQIHIARLSFSTLNDLRTPGKVVRPLPFDGFLEGDVKFSGPLAQLDNLTGRIEISNVEVRPNVRERLGIDERAKNLVLRNTGPIVIDVDGKGLHVQSAKLTAQDTNLEVAGDFSFHSKTPWDLRVKGFVNLAVLETFNPDFLASGNSTLNVVVRGSLEQPQVNGTLELKNAAFSLHDIPNGLDQANGVIVFDRNRATIQSLTAQSGGGELSVTGFVGFGDPEMIYRLQATANRVRVRYPEGVSTTLNATLNFTGTSTNSILSGGVTIMRLGFNPRTDIGGLLQESAKPISAPYTPTPFLRGMQFDVRIETAPNVQFQTSLTRDIQAETDLRLRGSLARPVLLGHISITQGEIQFFGNRYTINRGEIGFFNPVKIQPVLDMDLETRVRGITVNINFSGPVNRLTSSYRSDPPLQSQEIIALLAVGRAPAGTPMPGAGQTVESTSFLQTGANTLLGQAVAAPVSNRLQRFFGVSRLKIDPQITGADNTPQARLTIEQQVSRDVTVTYVTNLARTNQQLIQIQWDINRTWSVIALREENGIFGMDFQYRRQFK